LTLGELIDKLESLDTLPDDDREVVFDFEYLFPTYFSSWRGNYDELALGFSSHEEGDKAKTILEFKAMCKGTVGETFHGYKGGDFVMDESTPIWVANYKNSGSTALVGVIDEGHKIVLLTEYKQSVVYYED
jgi:hypothetical protein